MCVLRITSGGAISRNQMSNCISAHQGRCAAGVRTRGGALMMLTLRCLQALHLVGTIGFVYLLATHPADTPTVLWAIEHPWTVWLVGPLFASLTGWSTAQAVRSTDPQMCAEQGSPVPPCPVERRRRVQGGALLRQVGVGRAVWRRAAAAAGPPGTGAGRVPCLDHLCGPPELPPWSVR